MAIERIEVVQLPVQDLARAKEFYRRFLLLGISTDTPSGVPGGSAVFDSLQPGASLHLQKPPSPYGAPDSPIVALQVAAGTDIAGLLAEIETAGGAITYRHLPTPDLLVVGFTDSEGNNLELLVHH